MTQTLRDRIAARIREIIGNQKIVDLGKQGGPSRSYIYRSKKSQNMTVEKLDALLRSYGSNLGEFFEPWKEEQTLRRQELIVDARLTLERVVLETDVDLAGLVQYLHVLAGDEPRRRDKSKQ